MASLTEIREQIINSSVVELQRREKTSLFHNIGKKVTFINGIGEEEVGYIQGGGYHYSDTFAYVISKAKKPRSHASLGAGTWYFVSPLAIIL